ncbi:unnamed protein product [Penicillium nalgiovense]|nr:unnamed protein product [Penicillium nalgiovense]
MLYTVYLGTKLLLYLVKPPIFPYFFTPVHRDLYIKSNLSYYNSITFPSYNFLSPILQTSQSTPDGIEMCNFFKNFYIYSTCSNPAAHFLRTEMEGTKDNTTCNDGPHDRFIVVVGKCVLCSSAR